MNLKQKLNTIIDSNGDLRKIEETTFEVMQMIMQYGFFTGSYIFKSDKYQDIDVIFPPNTPLSWDDIYRNHHGMYLKDYQNDWGFKSLYVMYNNEIYNLLFTMSTETYNEWKYATNKMLLYIQQHPLEAEIYTNKEYRIKLFESFKKSYNDF